MVDRSSSMARRIQVQIGLIIAAVTVAATLLSYWQTMHTTQAEALDNLKSATRTRAAFEAQTFVQAQDNTVALRTEYLRRLQAMGNADPVAAFNSWFVRYPDGLIRVRPERDDHKHLPSIYIRKPVVVTPELRRQVVTAFQLLSEWGPAMTLRYYSAYIDLPGMALIMYSPSVNWGKEADTSTNNFDYPPVQNSAPDKNPRRETLWTEVYFDDKARIWMLSTITPIDQVRWVGTASQDIAVDELIHRTTNDFANGTYNLVFDGKGRLIAHPRLMEKIRSSAGNLDVAALGDNALLDFYNQAIQASDGEVRVSSDGSSYLGVARIQGPGWYFVTLYPKALVEKRGLESARTILLAGALGLVIELTLLAWIIRRQIAEPLQALSDATQDVANGRLDVTIDAQAPGELGALGRSFADMTASLRERDEALTARASQLEGALRELQQADASLDRSEALRETLFHTIPDVVFVKDLEGRFIAANRAFEAVYGKTMEAIGGKTDFDFLDRELAQYFADRDSEAMAAGVPTVSESWQLNSVTGQLRYFETIKMPVYGPDGAALALLGIGRDVTERRNAQEALLSLNQDLEARVQSRTEALEQANGELSDAMDVLKRTQTELIQGEKLASLGRMVAGLAHELNTPIGNALTIGTTMGDHARQAQQAMQGNKLTKSSLEAFLKNTVDGVAVLERALMQASELISSFKQVSADQLSERRRVFDLAITVEEIVSTLRPGFRTTPYAIAVEVPAGIIMDSYPGILAQVISNLVNNARIHGFDGLDSGAITIQAVDQVDQVEITVSDDGIGIAENIRSRIFDPFFTTRMGRGGTGLGLSIVHGAVTQGLCGAVRVAHGEKSGTRFIITLPKVVRRKPGSEDADTALP